MAGGGAPKRGWYRDPTGRHDLRRWDGDGWSEWVIDGGRRSFDDIDGCGGPPQGEVVAVSDAPLRTPRGVAGRVRRAGGESADAMLPAPEPASAALPLAVGAALVAAAVAAVVVVLGERGVLASAAVASDDDLVRRYLLPIVLALGAFEAVLGGAMLLLRRRAAAATAPWRRVSTVGRDEVLRGLAAFLLALFARTFLVATFASPFAGAVRPVGPWPLFVLEAVLLVAVAPVVEEVVFRGAVFTALRNRTRPVVAVLGQALLYGVAFSWIGIGTSHFAAGLGAFAVGAVLGWFVHTTNDLRPVIVGHAVLNGWFLAERLLAWT